MREDAIHLREQRGTQLVGPASRDVVRPEHGRRPIVTRRADSRTARIAGQILEVARKCGAVLDVLRSDCASIASAPVNLVELGERFLVRARKGELHGVAPRCSESRDIRESVVLLMTSLYQIRDYHGSGIILTSSLSGRSASVVAEGCARSPVVARIEACGSSRVDARHCSRCSCVVADRRRSPASRFFGVCRAHFRLGWAIRTRGRSRQPPLGVAVRPIRGRGRTLRRTSRWEGQHGRSAPGIRHSANH